MMGGSSDSRPSNKTSSSIGDLFFLSSSFSLTGDSGQSPLVSDDSDVDAPDQLDLVLRGEISCTETVNIMLVLS